MELKQPVLVYRPGRICQRSALSDQAVTLFTYHCRGAVLNAQHKALCISASVTREIIDTAVHQSVRQELMSQGLVFCSEKGFFKSGIVLGHCFGPHEVIQFPLNLFDDKILRPTAVLRSGSQLIDWCTTVSIISRVELPW